ncbi:hypothetical protein HGA88_03445 [Candidatus Roizmanbacteria bacterium]|nr:hypothetical protein [Candidatus Roizmanbacteria bacterium]
MDPEIQNSTPLPPFGAPVLPTTPIHPPIIEETKPKKPLFLQPIMLVVYGLVALLVLLLVFGLVRNAIEGSHTAQISPTPIPTVQPTPTVFLSPTPNLQSVIIGGKARIQFSEPWKVITAIPDRYSSSDEKTKATKIISKTCTGPILQNSLVPTSIIVFDTLSEIKDQPTFCWTNGNFNDYNIRKISTFNAIRDMKVVKWKPNAVFENGVFQQPVWQKTLFEEYTQTSDELKSTVSMALLFQDATDGTAESTLDQIISSFHFLTKGQVDPISTWTTQFFDPISVKLPPSWWKKTSATAKNEKILLINPQAISEDQQITPAFDILDLAAQSTDEALPLLTNTGSLTNVKTEEVKLENGSYIRLNATNGAQKQVLMAIFSVRSHIVVFQDNALADNHAELFDQIVKTISW